MARFGNLPLRHVPYFGNIFLKQAEGILGIIELPAWDHYRSISVYKNTLPYAAFVKHSPTVIYYLLEIFPWNHYLRRLVLGLVVKNTFTNLDHRFSIGQEGIVHVGSVFYERKGNGIGPQF